MCIIGTWASSSTGCVYLGKQMCSGSIAVHVMALLFFFLLLGYCCNSEMRGLHLKWSDKGRGFWGNEEAGRWMCQRGSSQLYCGVRKIFARFPVFLTVGFSHSAPVGLGLLL